MSFTKKDDSRIIASRRIVQRSYVKVCVETLLSLKGLFVIHKWTFCNFNVVSTYSNFGVDYDVGTVGARFEHPTVLTIPKRSEFIQTVWETFSKTV